jgi:trans-aconitate 2-methyltransferase
MSWSAAQYLKFENERTRPVRDLLAALPPLDARTAVDIGCGPGNSTELLAARFPDAALTGLDNSADMISAARKRLPMVRFEVADIETWVRTDLPRAEGSVDGSVDVILANAVLHWVCDHAALFPALVARLTPGGALAVQMPDNLDEASHRLMREVAASGPWRSKLATAAAERVAIASADWYFNLLHSICAETEIWRTTYYHALAGGDAIVEWFKGSGLRPFLAPLDDAECAAYLLRYTAEVKRAYPPLSDGTVLLPFPRLFIVAVR